MHATWIRITDGHFFIMNQLLCIIGLGLGTIVDHIPDTHTLLFDLRSKYGDITLLLMRTVNSGFSFLVATSTQYVHPIGRPMLPLVRFLVPVQESR